MKTHFLLFSLVFALSLYSGCGSIDKATSVPTDTPAIRTTPEPSKTAPNTTEPTRTATNVPEPTRTTTNTPEPTPILPSSLYFLAGMGEEAQVYQLGSDGTSLKQITHVRNGVDAFAVSPKDARIALVSNNQLFLMEKNGENGILIADGHTVDENVEDYIFRSQVSSPSFSPDGRKLAYGFNGLHIYDIPTGEDLHALTNLGNLLGEPFVFSKEVYAPGPWSPDGSLLLIYMGYYEGDTLAVMEPGAEQPFRRLWSDGPICCTYNWSSDGKSVLAGNPYYTGDIPGIWQFDAKTGAQNVVVKGLEENGSINFAGWANKLVTGDLLFFYVNLARFSPDVGISLQMVRSDPNGAHIEPVRPEIFHIIDVLWTRDGSAAVILQPGDEKGTIQITFARTDNNPLQILFQGQRIRYPAWGP